MPKRQQRVLNGIHATDEDRKRIYCQGATFWHFSLVQMNLASERKVKFVSQNDVLQYLLQR